MKNEIEGKFGNNPKTKMMKILIKDVNKRYEE